MSELRQRKKPPAEETTTVAGPEPPTVKLHTVSFETFGAEYGVTVSDWDDGTLIEDCEPNDLIYRSGLRKGDVIKTINGKLYVRISAAVYNELSDYQRLADVVNRADFGALGLLK